MKKILLGITALLFIAFHAAGQTPPPNGNMRNSTKCAVTVTRECYDICVLTNSVTRTLDSGQTTPLSIFGSCPPANTIVYRVCWIAPAPGRCTGTPPVPCVRVNGSNPPAPAPCGAGTFSGTIQYCFDCNPSNPPTGVTNVDFNPAPGNTYLWIH